jgi:SAM-dependent methyltransferase
MNPFRKATDRLLELPVVYRSLQAPFADAKLRPFLRRVDPGAVRTVLDVGCGPGTNASVFDGAGYVGVDINADYVARCRSRFRGRFVVGDVTDEDVFPEDRFECVFANSLMHHLPDEAVAGLLARMARLVEPGGAVHVLDLILPNRPTPARLLARLDRGRYARPLEGWKALFRVHLEQRHLEVYPVGLPGLPLWWMVYFEGVPKS